MKCYKCKREMFPMLDTAWRKRKDGTRTRLTEFVCTECRVFIAIDVCEYEYEHIHEENGE